MDGQAVNVTVTCVLGHLMEVDFPEQFRKWSSCSPAELFDAPVDKRVNGVWLIRSLCFICELEYD
jgi:DNA topoisomerase IA